MRVGQNPAKAINEVSQPAKVTVAVIVYIPFLSGYYAQSLEVLKICLESIWDNTDLPYDLMVFDNASCQKVREYLLGVHGERRIQYLVLSDENIGKVGAWNYVFGAAPGEYIAYADSDVYFYPNWLSPQLEIFERFPKVGMVTGMPMLTLAKYSTSTVEWAQASENVRLESGRFLPWEDFWRHASSLGGDEVSARHFYESNEDVCLFHDQDKYFVGASHFQFVTSRETVQSVLPIPSNRPMGEVRALDVAINGRGYLRLCTDSWYAQHMGNTVPEEGFFIGETGDHSMSPGFGKVKGFAKNRLVRKFLQWVNNRSFEILYKN
jgi:glycosyltransferase involved in cell wall biosynthesis